MDNHWTVLVEWSTGMEYWTEKKKSFSCPLMIDYIRHCYMTSSQPKLFLLLPCLFFSVLFFVFGFVEYVAMQTQVYSEFVM